MSKDLAGRFLLIAALVAVSWAALIFATGGFVWESSPFRFTSRDPFRPLVVGLMCALAYWYVALQAVATFVDRVDRAASRRGALIVLVLAVVVAAVGLKWATYAASGADAYGYVSQADLWLSGHLRIDQRSLALPPPFDDWAFSPLGYHPGPTRHVLVPTYPPGLPLLMAAAKSVAGSNAPYYVVPLTGALAVLLTYLLGRLLFDDLVGVAAAALFSVSPTFQFQLMWPMSDVPATAAWTLALVFAVLRRPFAAGLASGAATVLRPNLVVLTAGVGIVALWPEIRNRNVRRDLIRTSGAFAAGVLPAVIGIAVLHTYLYGGPTSSGYTPMDTLFRWRHLVPNVTRYISWLLETQTPFIAVALLPLASRRFTLPHTPGERTYVRFGISIFLALLAASYFFYQPYEDWWFLRFFLPAFPVLLVLAVGALRSTTPLLGGINQQVVLGAVVVAVFGWELSTAQWRGVYTVQNTEQRYVTVGRDLGTTTPTNAVFLAMQHSGSLRYYSGRLTVRYDSLPPGSLDAAIAVLRAHGLHPYFLLERWEEAAFRERFREKSAAGRIDWPPTKKWVTPARIALYDPADRPKFVRQ